MRREGIVCRAPILVKTVSLFLKCLQSMSTSKERYSAGVLVDFVSIRSRLHQERELDRHMVGRGRISEFWILAGMIAYQRSAARVFFEVDFYIALRTIA